MKYIYFLFLLLTFVGISQCNLQKKVHINNKNNHNHKQHKSKHKNHLKKHHQKITKLLQQRNKQPEFLEVPLKTQGKSQKHKIKQINDLAKHQALLMQKDQYTHVEFDQEQQQHTSNLIQIGGIKGISNKLQQSKYHNNKMSLKGNKSFLKLEQAEQGGTFIQENEMTETYVPLLNHQNTFFTGEVSVGDADTSFEIIFDTGSSLTFINSVNCDDSGCKKGTQYDSNESDSHEDLNGEVEVEFGSGTLRGTLASENFYINGMKVPETTFIEITQQEGEVFEDGDFDGIVGLSFPDLGDDTPTLFDFMIEKKVIKDPVFSFYMNRSPGSTDSRVIFGGIDESLYQNDIVYHNVTNEYYWVIEAEQIRVGDKDTGICTLQNKCKLVVDSGTSLFTGPTNDLQTLLNSLDSGEEGCKNLYDLDDIVFVVDGHEYNVPPQDYILTVTKEGVEDPYEHSDMDEVIQCVGAFYSLDIDAPAGPLWVLGDVFMSRYYSVFEKGVDGKPNRIGLSRSNID